jgi:hypothetical protein
LRPSISAHRARVLYHAAGFARLWSARLEVLNVSGGARLRRSRVLTRTRCVCMKSTLTISTSSFDPEPCPTPSIAGEEP